MAIIKLPRLSLFVRPNRWETVDTAIAWIAFGSAIQSAFWDHYAYLGASRWDRVPPRLLMTTLLYWNDPENAYPPAAEELRGILRAWVAAHQESGEPGNDEQIAAVAKEAGSHFRDEMEKGSNNAIEARYNAILDAAEQLRRAAARGDCPLYGWAGPLVDRRKAKEPREKMPSDLLARPVLLTGEGIFPKVIGHTGGDREALYTDLLIDSDDLLRAFPDSGVGEPAVEIPQEERSAAMSGEELTKARAWMTAYLFSFSERAAQPPKRDATEKLCQKQVPCRHAAARTAWNEAPEQWKGRPRTPVT